MKTTVKLSGNNLSVEEAGECENFYIDSASSILSPGGRALYKAAVHNLKGKHRDKRRSNRSSAKSNPS